MVGLVVMWATCVAFFKNSQRAPVSLRNTTGETDKNVATFFSCFGVDAAQFFIFILAFSFCFSTGLNKPFEIELAMLATAMLATVCDQKRY
jgi:hypothetical protein